MNLTSSVIVFLIFLVSYTNSFTQLEFSAEEAVLKALENNYQILIAKKQVEIAEKNNKWSEAGAFPTVDLTTAFGNSIVDNTNNPFTFTPGLIQSNQITPGLSANWNIFTGMGVSINKKRLDQLEEQSKGNSMLILENTAHDVLKAYYDAVLQEERLTVLKELYRFSLNQSNYEDKRQEFGQSDNLSIFQLRNQLFSDSLNVLQQEMVCENAKRNLLLLMNVEQELLEKEPVVKLKDSLAMVLNTINQSQVISDMKSNNQNLKNQYINLELQKTTTALQKSFLYPVVSLQFGVNPNVGYFSSLSDNDLSARTQQVTYFGNINIRYSLFNNWKDKRAVEVARIQEDIATMNVEELDKQLTVNALNLLRQFELRSQLVRVASKNAAYAKLAYDTGRERYELGAINSIALAQLQNAYLNARLEYFNTLHQRIDIYLELYKLTGKLQLIYAS
jgi:outer membrane protein TolC